MAINEWNDIDFYAEAKERYTEQFQNKPVFDKYIRLLLSGFEIIQNTLKALQTERSIDTAVGAQLDVIGEIVGRPRGVVSGAINKYFGFDGEPRAGTFGSLNNKRAGAPWYSEGELTTTSRAPTDDEYRIILKAKILQNRTNATVEDFIRAYQFLFDTSKVTIDEYASCKVKVVLGRPLTTVERSLLFDLEGVGNLLPKPLGVQMTFIEYQYNRVFAFAGYPDAKGFGDYYDDTTGGVLASITG